MTVPESVIREFSELREKYMAANEKIPVLQATELE